MQFIHTKNLLRNITISGHTKPDCAWSLGFIAVIFAWNNLWLGKLPELPSKYQNDTLRTLLNGNSLA
jgi:hypothetical protein